MLILVIISNLLITMLNLYVIWQIWRLRQLLVKVTNYLNVIEQNVKVTLKPAPQAIIQGKTGARSLKISYQKLELQIQQVRKILQLLSLVARVKNGSLVIRQ